MAAENTATVAPQRSSLSFQPVVLHRRVPPDHSAGGHGGAHSWETGIDSGPVHPSGEDALGDTPACDLNTRDCQGAGFFAVVVRTPGMLIDGLTWLTQDVVLPLYAVVVILVLPVGYIGRLVRRLIEDRLPDDGT